VEQSIRIVVSFDPYHDRSRDCRRYCTVVCVTGSTPRHVVHCQTRKSFEPKWVRYCRWRVKQEAHTQPFFSPEFAYPDFESDFSARVMSLSIDDRQFPVVIAYSTRSKIKSRGETSTSIHYGQLRRRRCITGLRDRVAHVIAHCSRRLQSRFFAARSSRSKA